MNIEKVGSFIATRRKELGMTQNDLGTVLGVSSKAVSKWERGLCCPDIAILTELARTLRVSIMELLSGESTDIVISSARSISEAEKASVPETDGSFTFAPPTNTAVSPLLFGSNLEHTRSSVFQGISAQMLRNRKFSGKPGCTRGNAMEWFPIGDETYLTMQDAAYTHHAEKYYHMRRQLETYAQRVQNFTEGAESGIGQHSLAVSENTPYLAAVVLTVNKPILIRMSLTDRYGRKIYAQQSFLAEGDTWKRYEVRLIPNETDPDADLRITFEEEGWIQIGAVSLLPEDNFHGMRKDVVAALKTCGVRVLRWPGGNFAGEYCWFDGLLPVDERCPSESFMRLETQPHTMGYDQSEISTDDFIALCREIGAEPYITINIAWNTPKENAAWVEYCNGSPETEWGAKRAAAGHPEPYGVNFWTLGNEAGYGHMEGDNSPYGYSITAEQNARAMLAVSPDLTLCVSGPYPNDEWADHSLKPISDIVRLVSFHQYTNFPDYGTDDLKTEYERKLGELEACRDHLIQVHDKSYGVNTSFDEWNVWYAWYRPSSVYDGIFYAGMLHLIIGEAAACGIAVACQFEAVNEGLMVVRPEGVELTAAGKMYALMSRHCGGRIIKSTKNLLATEKDGITTLTFINSSYDQTAELTLHECSVKRAELFSSEEIRPYTNFAETELTGKTADKTITYSIPPHSVAAVTINGALK